MEKKKKEPDSEIEELEIGFHYAVKSHFLEQKKSIHFVQHEKSESCGFFHCDQGVSVQG